MGILNLGCRIKSILTINRSDWMPQHDIWTAQLPSANEYAASLGTMLPAASETGAFIL